MSIPSIPGGLFFIAILLYLLPIIGVIYWMVKMVKMLNNSNENLRINREILRKLEEKP